jgi:hypothetical protein
MGSEMSRKIVLMIKVVFIWKFKTCCTWGICQIKMVIYLSEDNKEVLGCGAGADIA